MDVRPYKLLARLFNPLIRGMVVNAIERDMDAVKEYCQRNHGVDNERGRDKNRE